MTATKGQKPHRGKQVTVAEFKRMWCDPTMTVADIAKQLDVCARSVWQRARHRGLLPRSRYVQHCHVPILTAEDEAMYRAGVDANEIAARRGIKVQSVYMHMWRNGIRRETRISRHHKAATIAEFQLREAMAATARQEQAALRMADMVDGFHLATSGRKRAA